MPEHTHATATPRPAVSIGSRRTVPIAARRRPEAPPSRARGNAQPTGNAALGNGEAVAVGLERDLAGALKSCGDWHAIAERLAQSDPGNAGWQRDLAISYAKLAQVYRRSKDREKALAALRQGKAIMDRLVELSPDNADWKRDLAWFDQQIAALME